MQSKMSKRTAVFDLARTLLVALALTSMSAALPRTARAQQSCDDGNECTTIDSCQADGSCKGTNKPNGTACTPGPIAGDCVISAACNAGICTPTSSKQAGTPCTSTLLGACAINPTCQPLGLGCFGEVKQCPDDGNKCTIEVCNPQSGACTSVPFDCNDDCSTGQCNPDTGDCVNTQNRPDGTACDDFNNCTSNDRCSNGECRGSTTPVATATLTPTGLASFTPTATPQPPTPTLSATATQTSAAPPTATATASSVSTSTATPQATPPASSCTGDCGGNDEVTVDELIKGVNIALGNLPVTDCPSLDTNADGEVTVNELIQGVNNALSGCPTPAPTATPTTTPTVTATPTVTLSATPTVTLSATPTVTLSATPTLAPPTATLTATLAPTSTSTATPSAAQTESPTTAPTPSQTPTPPVSATATILSTATPTLQATLTPTASAPPTASATEGEEPTETPEPSETAEPTETPEPSVTEGMTPTESPAATPTPTLGGPSIPQRAAGAIQTTTTGLLVVPNILSAILGHTGGGLGSAAGLIDVPFTCPAGGSGQVSCSQSVIPMPPFIGPPSYTITLTDCKVSGTAGTSLAFTGTIMAAGKQGDSCLSIPSSVDVTIPSLVAVSQGTGGTTTATFTDVSGSIALSGQDNTCTYSAATFNLVGKMKVESKDPQGAPLGSTEITFSQGSSIQITVTQYGNDCVPTIYDTTVQGGMTFSSNGNSFAATFTNYTIHNNATSGNNVIEVSGEISSPCLGAAIQLSTTTDLLVVGVEPCPRAGSVLVMSANSTDRITYDMGSVKIDLGANGDVDQSAASCLDPALYQCPAS